MRDGVVIIPDVPSGISEDHAKFLQRIKESLEVLQGSHARSKESRRAATYGEIQGRMMYDRGDPESADFFAGDLTTDGNWHDLDLREIIPYGATAVYLRISIEDDAAGSVITFRKKGNQNTVNILRMVTQDAGDALHGNGIVFCDANRTIEYMATNTTWTTINIAVTKYFK